jgi:hypothetical protein
MRLELDGGADLYSYKCHNQANRQSPFAHLFIDLGKNNHRLALKGSFEKASNFSSDYISGEEGMISRITNHQDFFWESILARTGFDIQCTRDYTEPIEEIRVSGTRENEMFASSVFLQAFPKTRFFLGYNYGWVDYTKNTDKTKNCHFERYWIGVNGQIAKKILGLIRVGIEDRNFKGMNDSDRDIAFNINLTYNFNTRTIFLLKVSHGLADPKYVSAAVDKGADASLSATQKLGRKLACDLSFGYSHNKYDTGQDDNTYTARTRFNYALQKWCGLFIGYTHRFTESTVEASETKDNLCEMGSNIIF